ncbi:MAG: hypothetical protein CMQ70_00780 [Gammaproteobacteria bacterium]|nr:hypothetical protein [Gammaproteobacteria bacterium]
MRIILFLLLTSSLNLYSQQLPQNIPPEALKLLEQEDITQLANSAGVNAVLKKKEIEDKILTDGVLENISDRAGPKSANFGYDFFNKKSSALNISNDIPFQADYKISFNDLLKLNLTGNKKAEYDLLVDLSGMVNIPEIGKISLNNLTLSEAQTLIYDLIESAYLGTKPYLSIVEASLKKVSVIGAVNNNGTFLVNPFVSISEAISYAGGLTNGASLRKVKVIRKNGSVEEVDLYKFLVFGDRGVDLNLENGDTLLIQKTDNFISLKGAVQTVKIFEFMKDETYEDIIGYAGGFKRNTNISKIAVVIRNDDVLINKPVSIADKVDSSSIELFIPSFYTPDEQELFVRGPLNDGYYNGLAGKDLNFVLDQLPLTKDTYPFGFRYVSESNDGLLRQEQILPFDDEVLSEEFISRNPRLEFYDHSNVFIDGVNGLPAKSVLRVFFGGRQVTIPMAGKFIPREILNYSGITLDYDLEETFIVTKDETVKFEGLIDSEIEFQPRMALYFPEKRFRTINVGIIGAVNLPGNYILEDSSSLSELYRISGGFLDDADPNGVILKRQSVATAERRMFLEGRQKLLEKYISTQDGVSDQAISLNAEEIAFLLNPAQVFDGRVSGDLSPESQLVSNLGLEDGDVIFVPYKTNLVNVIGEVISPAALEISFSKNSYKDYIRSVGGFTNYADKSGVFIVNSNGKATRVNMFADIDIRPGDTIVVPRNYSKIEGLPLVTVSSRILSDLLLAAASLNAINN